jgi:hypothetical protein
MEPTDKPRALWPVTGLLISGFSVGHPHAVYAFESLEKNIDSSFIFSIIFVRELCVITLS